MLLFDRLKVFEQIYVNGDEKSHKVALIRYFLMRIFNTKQTYIMFITMKGKFFNKLQFLFWKYRKTSRVQNKKKVYGTKCMKTSLRNKYQKELRMRTRIIFWNLINLINWNLDKFYFFSLNCYILNMPLDSKPCFLTKLLKLRRKICPCMISNYSRKKFVWNMYLPRMKLHLRFILFHFILMLWASNKRDHLFKQVQSRKSVKTI